MVSRYPGPSIRAAFARRSCCARCRGVATASSDCSNSALLKVASFLGLRGRTSRPISCTFLTTSWRTRPTIVASCACWRARWGSDYQGTLRQASGNGRSEHENEADAEQAVGADERGLAGCSRARSSTAVLGRQEKGEAGGTRPVSGGSPAQQWARSIGKYAPEIGTLARAAIARLRRQLPGAVELVYDNYNALVIGFGPSERASEAVVSIALYPRCVSRPAV